ncbi:MAG: vitamin B12 dependent-methionine synthase activation domain-containing protein [Chloroflexota bacterium]|nr:vitamin B12 dependent-methionine synthase activation domain-containing protein [Chloroflexota bacterium]
MEVLDNVPFRLDIEGMLKLSHVWGRNQHIEEVARELIDIALPVARPRAVYEVSYVDNKNEDSLYINGIKFSSHVLRLNLDKVERVFPYVVTCGRELDQIAIPSSDLLRSYYMDVVREVVLHSARSYLGRYIREKYAVGQISRMSPGSLPDWPLTQQKELFEVFGDVEGLIGVKLTDSFLMLPVKSLSGIYFPTEIKFESCQLCPRKACIGRRAAYAPELARKYGGGNSSPFEGEK